MKKPIKKERRLKKRPEKRKLRNDGHLLIKQPVYLYKGDRLTDVIYKGGVCIAVRRTDGKTIRGRNGNMLVIFGGQKVVVLARQLRKIKEDQSDPD